MISAAVVYQGATAIDEAIDRLLDSRHGNGDANRPNTFLTFLQSQLKPKLVHIGTGTSDLTDAFDDGNSHPRLTIGDVFAFNLVSIEGVGEEMVELRNNLQLQDITIPRELVKHINKNVEILKELRKKLGGEWQVIFGRLKGIFHYALEGQSLSDPRDVVNYAMRGFKVGFKVDPQSGVIELLSYELKYILQNAINSFHYYEGRIPVIPSSGESKWKDTDEGTVVLGLLALIVMQQSRNVQSMVDIESTNQYLDTLQSDYEKSTEADEKTIANSRMFVLDPHNVKPPPPLGPDEDEDMVDAEDGGVTRQKKLRKKSHPGGKKLKKSKRLRSRKNAHKGRKGRNARMAARKNRSAKVQ